MLFLALAERRRDVLLGVLDILHPHDTFQQDILRCVEFFRRHDAGTINEVDALHERDVLPHFGLAGNRGDFGDFLFAEGIDDGGFAGVWVADEADRDLFAGGVEGGELTKEGDQRAFAEGIRHGGVESESWVGFGEVADPCGLFQSCVSTEDIDISKEALGSMKCLRRY